jgi:predicted TIM-barrel fold metal-dependent hydrolase
MIDTNVNLSRWAFRRLAGDTPEALTKKLRSHGVTSAWAASFDGLLHRDVAAVNTRLAEECLTHKLFVPFGTVNPKLPDWQEDVRRCQEVHRMKGLRLHPNYHGYTLKDQVFGDLLGLAAKHKLVVQLVLSMEDPRTQHPLVRVPVVDTAPLAEVLHSFPKLPVQLLNIRMEGEPLRKLAQAGQVYFDFAMMEKLGGVELMLRSVPLERMMFGSHAPLFYFESALFKVKEAGLSEEQKRAILEGNAKRFLSGAAS